MKYYEEVYNRRLNRYGIDFQSRLQGQREELFNRQLKKSIYYVIFDFDGEEREGELTPFRQSETKDMQYLLTSVHLNIPNGTVLEIPNKDLELVPWMVYYLEDLKASGYNRYIMLRMTHYIEWKDRQGEKQSSWAYMYGQENNMLKDELRSRSRMDTLYTENLKLSFFVMPLNTKLRKDDYFEVEVDGITEAYRVTGYDLQSTPGVQFVSVDPIYVRDHTPAPEKKEEDTEEEFFWIEYGGRKDG